MPGLQILSLSETSFQGLICSTHAQSKQVVSGVGVSSCPNLVPMWTCQLVPTLFAFCTLVELCPPKSCSSRKPSIRQWVFANQVFTDTKSDEVTLDLMNPTFKGNVLLRTEKVT